MAVNPTRRDTLVGMAAAVGLPLLPAVAGESSMAGSMPKIRAAFAATREPKPLHFDPGKLKGLSERLIQSHWENNYIGSVKALNMIETRLSAAMQDPDVPPLVYGGLKREELHRVGSVILHEHYFNALGGDGKPGGALLEALKTAYGSVAVWEAEFRRTALSLAGGSGWCVLTFNAYTGELRNQWAWDHMHGSIAGLPLIVLDMYEHAFHMDYGAAAAKYVDAWFANLDWERLDQAWLRAVR
jgi:Fe-Mn family superoxide dismutase